MLSARLSIFSLLAIQGEPLIVAEADSSLVEQL